MAPDLNSLLGSSPQSSPRSPPTQRPRRISINTGDASRPNPPSPLSPSAASRQAAATMTAGLQRSPSRPSPRLERRRSSLMNNFSVALGTVDHHHQRQLSMGELHQELENEQEAQTNRLLRLIRLQQEQLAALGHSTGRDSSAIITDQSGASTTPSSTLVTPTSAAVPEQTSPRSTANHPSIPIPPAGPFDGHGLRSQQSSSRLSAAEQSRASSPASRPHAGSLGSGTESLPRGGVRDEGSFYQAETQSLTKENQILKARIRELEQQISQMSATAGPSSDADELSRGTTSVSHPATSASEAQPIVAVEARHPT